MEIASAAASGGIGAAAQSRATLAGNFDTFLKLLTTQLRNQDPLEPLDSNEFTQQLVQFTSVEQQIAANENLEKILAAMRADQAAASLGFIGKQIEAATDTTGLPPDGEAVWTYALSGTADRVTLSITDATGRLVHVAEGQKAAGRHVFAWDGRDNAGAALPPGSYTLTAAARDGANKVIPAEVGIRGLVTGASATAGGNAAVLIGDTEIPLSAVTRASIPAAEAPPPQSTVSSLLSRLDDIL